MKCADENEMGLGKFCSVSINCIKKYRSSQNRKDRDLNSTLNYDTMTNACEGLI